ncbi:hypothetical protein PYK79_54595 [Streptomyces sp. ID05-04B]|uniref:hypothetical protein n=1 Tax=Streptomyces sp. ID05-04B TaxID=3028661 RepID=UPI0029C2715F|nr:hypothetical protein [Streptomyces sp. ID05-04B]MDX5570519.1 hypothetical protein [Streptomyces sp. ID05-04B]
MKHAAAVVADYLSAPVSLRYDRYSQERYGRHHDRKCNRHRRPRPRPRPIRPRRDCESAERPSLY